MANFNHLLFGDNRDPRVELGEIFGVGVPDSGDIQPEALAWARTVVDPTNSNEVKAIHDLRQAEPRLGLKSATYLARRLFAQ
ncbi:MAG: hypothetical protein U0P48_05080 [Ancrocorticia sp.]|mgnify:CR=1 FL=1